MSENRGQMIGYPIGEQDFKSLREMGCIYVDKTRFIKTIIDSRSKYYFLSRPRRFGKSLFLSTLRYFFEGKKELFKGLDVDSLDWDWEIYPVLNLDLNTNRYAETGVLEDVLDNLFRDWEKKYDITNPEYDYSQRFKTIIRTAYEKTGRQVVILVDEYDKPLVGNINNDDNFEHYRTKLSSLYSNFKSMAEYIRLVFLTGVSRFSKLSIFSDLNNIKDISFSDDFADICGITEKEMLKYFNPGIRNIASKIDVSFEKACSLLKLNYDGYRFAAEGSDIYNPWSLLNAMAASRISNYWNQTGMPTLIAEALYNTDVDLEKTLNSRCRLDTLSGLDLRSVNPIALLYQTGYLTIKNYVARTDTVTLCVPNREVRQGLFDVLLPYYVKVRRGTPDMLILDILDNIHDGKPEDLIKNLDIFFAGIPYELKMDNENNFHNALYILLTLIGINTDAEVSTSDGRIDIVLKTEDYIYIIELKFDHDSQTALNQIVEKGYDLAYQNDSRKRFLIGINFSSKTRRLDKPAIIEK